MKTILEQASRIKESGVNLSIDFSEQNNKDLIQSLGPMSEIGIFSRPGTLDSEIPQILQCLHEAGFALVIMTRERALPPLTDRKCFVNPPSLWK